MMLDAAAVAKYQAVSDRLYARHYPVWVDYCALNELFTQQHEAGMMPMEAYNATLDQLLRNYDRVYDGMVAEYDRVVAEVWKVPLDP